MTDLSAVTKAELLKRSEEQYNAYEQYLSRFSEQQLTERTDHAGWSVKDHLYHLALAEGSLLALLDRKPIREYLGVDAATYKEGDDAVNAVVQQRTRDLPLREVLDTLRRNHQQVMERISATPEAELQRPFNEYQPDDDPRDSTVMLSLLFNTFHHYEEHFPWIVDILKDRASGMPKAELLERIEGGFRNINNYLDSLSETQLTQPTDAVGWTAKDHVIHMATWEEAVLAFLGGVALWEHMNVDREIWKQGDDAINAVIQQRYIDMSLADVRRAFRENHQRVMNKLQSLTDEELHRPYNHYQPKSKQDQPAFMWIQSHTNQHYEKHQPWIAAIVQGK
jgi:hypothetical protein